MKFIDIFRMAMGNLRRNRMRTVLTVAGVVVGIGAIVFLVSLGYGLQSLLISKTSNLEALTVIKVSPGKQADTVINDSALEKFRSVPGVKAVSPLREFISLIKAEGESASPVIYAVKKEYFPFEDIKIQKGAGFSADNAKEVIISQSALESLKINPEKAIGMELSFEGVRQQDGKSQTTSDGSIKLKVVGVMTEKNAYVPLETLRQFSSESYSSVKVKVEERNQVKEIMKTINSMGFQTTNTAGEQVAQIDNAFVVIRSVLGGFGLISLLVAAIGIFNTMTISLLERTHEIGIMKAIGGRSRDVALIFTMEAAIIGFMGGILGVASGWLLGEGINALMNFIASQVNGVKSDVFYTPLSFAGIVVLFSFLISTIAGIWPARRASKLNPLEALRYE